MDAFPQTREAPINDGEGMTSKGSSPESKAVAASLPRLVLFDILACPDIAVLILSKFLSGEDRASLACTCALGREVAAAGFFHKNLLFADCQKFTDNALQSLVLRATTDVREGAGFATVDLSGCTQLTWGAVKDVLPRMGRLEQLNMLRGPCLHVQCDVVPDLLAELGAWTDRVAFSMRLGQGIGITLDITVLLLALRALLKPDPNLKIEAFELNISGELFLHKANIL
eukprot:gene1463-2086_t